MNQIDVLRAAIRSASQEDQTTKVVNCNGMVNTYHYPDVVIESGQFFPLSTMKKLLKEIEELEERCGEAHHA